MDSGMVPACGLVSFCVGTGHTQIGSESANVPDRAFSPRMSSLRFVNRPSSGGIAPGRKGNARGKFRDWLLFCVGTGAYTDHAPVRELSYKYSPCRLVRLPMDSGMVPACGLVSSCVELVQHRTSKFVKREVQLL